MNKVEFSVEKFMQKVNDFFPTNATYICFDRVAKFCSNSRSYENKQIAKVFRICIKRFFKY